MKIVQFKDGSYGIRKLTLFGYEYKDLTERFWWSRSSLYFTNCKGTLEQVSEIFDRMTDKGKVVKP